MPGVKISELPAATTPLDGTELLPVVQSGVTRQSSLANAVAGALESGEVVTGDPATSSGFWPDVTATTRMNRMRDRVFIGDGAAFTGNRIGTQGGFVPTGVQGANWAPRDSSLFVAQDTGLMAVTGFASNANIDMTGPTETIGVSGFVIGNKASRIVWAGYFDVQFEQGSGANGMEIALKNKSGSVTVPTPYFQDFNTCGIWMPAGGDATYGGDSNADCSVAIAIGRTSFPGGAATPPTWRKGIVFFRDSLTGSDGTTGTATAIEMGKGHTVAWRAPGNFSGFNIRSDVSAASSDVAIVAGNNIINFLGTGGVAIAAFQHTTNAVNSTIFSSAATGGLVAWRASGSDTNIGIQIRTKGTQAVRFQSQDSGATDEFRVGGINSNPVNYLWAYGTNAAAGLAVLSAAGADTNISIRLAPKGTGTVSFGTFTSNADAPVNGYITITDSSGNTRKLATIA